MLARFSTRFGSQFSMAATRKPATAFGRAFLSSSASTASSHKPPKRILITGACGQLGLALAHRWQQHNGPGSVIATDIRRAAALEQHQIPFRFVDVMQPAMIEKVVVEEETDAIVHFSAMLSFIGEQHPEQALDLNCRGFETVLKLARKHNQQVFCPSTIGVFGVDTPRDQVPDLVITRPNTIYGISKVHTELLGQYFHERFGVDFRSLRYPGILSADTLPGGGTTDYAIDIFHQLFKEARRHWRDADAAGSSIKYSFKCPLPPDATLPMMFIDDCLAGTMDFITAHLKDRQHPSRVYNVTALSFSPGELAQSLSEFLSRHRLVIHHDSAAVDAAANSAKGHELVVDFHMDYGHVDPMRAKIARSWPRSLDDSRARQTWHWRPEITTTDALVRQMATVMAREFGMSWRATAAA